MGEVRHNNRAFDDLVAEMMRDHPSEMALAGEWAAGWADGVKHGAAQIDALRAENAELKRDAERYRFARALENDCWMLNTLQRVSGAELDSAIDAALAKHRCATQPTDKP